MPVIIIPTTGALCQQALPDLQQLLAGLMADNPCIIQLVMLQVRCTVLAHAKQLIDNNQYRLILHFLLSTHLLRTSAVNKLNAVLMTPLLARPVGAACDCCCPKYPGTTAVLANLARVFGTS